MSNESPRFNRLAQSAPREEKPGEREEWLRRNLAEMAPLKDKLQQRIMSMQPEQQEPNYKPYTFIPESDEPVNGKTVEIIPDEIPLASSLSTQPNVLVTPATPTRSLPSVDIFADHLSAREIIEQTTRAIPERLALLPTSAERAFFYSFFRGFEIYESNPQKVKVITKSNYEKRRTLLRETAGIWASQVQSLSTKGEVLILGRKAYINLLLGNPENTVFTSEMFFAPFLLGMILAQRTLGRLPFTDRERAEKFIETFARLFGQPLGKIDISSSKLRGKSIKYYTIIVNSNVLDVLKESSPVVKGLRFYNAIFPPAPAKI